ncbi:MAG: PEGA domain-containing protein [bacterium]
MKIKKLGGFISLIFVLILLAAGTLFVYYYSKGYRIDILNGEIERTGVITVETIPRRATIYVDGKEKGKSPKAITDLTEGEHTVLIKKDGYQDWSMTVTVVPEQSIPVEIVMFYSTPLSDLISLPDIDTYQIDKFYTDKNNQIAIFTVMEETESILQVWGYPINRRFWELETNPYLITEFNIQTTATEVPTPIIDPDNFEILISPNSQRAILSSTVNSENSYFLFYTDRYVEEPAELDNLKFTGDVTPTWSEDSQYLVFSKNNELRTINVDSIVQTIIAEKTEKDEFIWTSTDTSQLYFVEKRSADYSIVRIRATGNNKSTVIENVVSLSSLSYTDDSEPKSSVVNDIHVSENGDYLIIMETERILVYSFKEDEFSLYPAENPVFLSFSPEGNKFLYTNGNNPNLFEYNMIVSSGDPIHVLGPRTLLDIHTVYSPRYFAWDPDEKSVLFTNLNSDNATYTIHSLSIDGLNEYVVYGLSHNDKFAIGNSGKYLVGVCEDEMLCKITVRE